MNQDRDPINFLHVGCCSHNTPPGPKSLIRIAGQGLDAPVFQEILKVEGLELKCLQCGDHLFVTPNDGEALWNAFTTTHITHASLGVQIERVGLPCHKQVTQEYQWEGKSSVRRNYMFNYDKRTVTQQDCYIPDHRGCSKYRFNPSDPERAPYIYITLKVKVGNLTDVTELRFRFPRTGTVTIGERGTISVTSRCLNLSHTFTEHVGVGNGNQNPIKVLTRHLKHSKIEGGKDALWRSFLSVWGGNPTGRDLAGVASLYNRKAYRPMFERLEADEPLDFQFLRWLHDTSTVGGYTNNQLIAAMIKEIDGDYDRMLVTLRTAREMAECVDIPSAAYKRGVGHSITRAICQTLPGAAEKMLVAAQAKDFRLHTDFSNQAQGIGVSKSLHPRLYKAIVDGDISIKVFNQPGKYGQPVNREFALWERALKRKGWRDTIFKVCANASRRSTYERDITPWLNSLFALPAYLDKHTPGRKKWKGFPKFVSTQWELEMGNEEGTDSQKTRKERSAFTPQVDNVSRIVTIPYVAVTVSGMRTQWCYSKNYYIFESGFTDPETGGIVINDFEKNLNGQGDDYGLMYFTLNGTKTARGYPTFLIIFERRDDKSTFVHFHRVRPSRSANGVKTPACQLVEKCYQYMAGNVPADAVTAQQGDLLFIKHQGDPTKAKAKVHPEFESGLSFEFESHRFVSDNPEEPLTMYRSAAKTPKNRMGFVHAPMGISVRHPEHDDIVGLGKGWYEIRRCKSYENNPVGIWSLTID